MNGLPIKYRDEAAEFLSKNSVWIAGIKVLNLHPEKNSIFPLKISRKPVILGIIYLIISML